MSNFYDQIDERLAALDVIELELLSAHYDLPVDDDEDGDDDEVNADEDSDDDGDANYDCDEQEVREMVAKFHNPLYWPTDDEDDKDVVDDDHDDDDEATVAMMPAADDGEASLATMPVANHDTTTSSPLPKRKNLRQSTLDVAFRNNAASAQKKQKTSI
jgi:hypothetical protein